MAKFVSNYPGTLILPSGDELPPGGEVSLTKEEAQNAGIAEWIEAGWLVEAGKVKVAAPSEDTASLKAELDAAQGTVKALTAELDAERAKTVDYEAERARNAELAAKVTELEAALAEATKPAAT